MEVKMALMPYFFRFFFFLHTIIITFVLYLLRGEV